jgi:hypothetical protein
MSAPQVQIPQPAPSPQSSAPRKRRRRAPATGAAEDCFTCASRSLICDRRRPYCSQCLDDGKDCSGYKTTLTWGIGVASRGKLRGLSLPVAGGQKVGQSESGREDKKRKHVHHATPQTQPESSKDTKSGKNNAAKFDTHSTAIKVEPQSTAPAHMSWHHQLPQTRVSIPSTLRTPQTYSTSFNGHVITPVSGGSARGISGDGLESPLMYNHPLQDIAHESNNTPFQGRSGVTSSLAAGFPIDECFSSQWHNLQDQESMTHFSDSSIRADNHLFAASMSTPVFTTPEPMTSQPPHKVLVEEVVYGNIASFTGHQTAPSGQGSPIYSSLSSEYRFSRLPFTGSTSIGKTPRMRYLINYYAEVISPVIVAFDSPSNPYRIHILQLAARSETLQHAISALSASNLRQRRETGALSTGKTGPARRSSMAHLSLTKSAWLPAETRMTAQDHAREESYHKGFSIQSLNAQLADPLVRKDDSILATLLILCLFHICDSGVAKFKTQFAGVKKLLRLRGDDTGNESRSTKWFTRMFTWFDAMTATVNDRDGELGQVHLDLSALSDEEWALENLAGCDGRLFKIIAKLGRLNLLSQGRSVESKSPIMAGPFPVVQPYSPFDGNGWSQILNDEDIWASKNSGLACHTETQFWREWREIRNDLQRWSLDTSLFDSSSSEASLLSAEQRLDLANISESFRYSALLYTERLASPGASSSDVNMQKWVQQALGYIRQVKSDVFLLWPLFITGSECATDGDRSVIRERCRDIQKDSGFFNNQSCLELLEKVWKANPPSPVEHGMSVVRRHRGFKFTEVMRQEKNEGEYIVV